MYTLECISMHRIEPHHVPKGISIKLSSRSVILLSYIRALILYIQPASSLRLLPALPENPAFINAYMKPIINYRPRSIPMTVRRSSP